MPPMPPLPTPVSAFASPPYLPLIITVFSSFPHGLASRSVQSFTTQHISFLLHRRAANEGPKSHTFRSPLFITLRRLLNSSLNLLLTNRRLIRITLDSRPIPKRFTESTFFGLFDPSYFLFASFGSGESGGGRVPFGVPI